jgi:hypothetical protein
MPGNLLSTQSFKTTRERFEKIIEIKRLRSGQLKLSNETMRRIFVMPDQQQSNSKCVIFGVLGFLAGIPLSYFFQSPLIRKIPLTEYLKLIPKMLTDSGKMTPEARAMDSAVLGNPIAVLVVTCIACAVLFALMGYFIDHTQKTSP